ncbi:MAG: 16S rRNA (guanine(966)-N(2))-methyltransferase RsmD [Nevskia sp.]|nr:16S rRNA (guanine(966)-N(2))-methyltransferase RsmD [Nevskia sp.]
MSGRRRLGTLRIIGGEWRSRLIAFDADVGVRPTPDRVRQTLFDWLAPLIDGASCLDLFAGSGALGFEALSRGAAHVSFVEQGAAQVAAIRAAAGALGAGSRAEIVQADGLGWLRAASRRYDVVFLDPPYGSGLLAPVLAALPPVLAPVHRIYLEWSKGQPPPLPAGYALLKEKAAGQVSYGLATYPVLGVRT